MEQGNDTCVTGLHFYFLHFGVQSCFFLLSKNADNSVCLAWTNMSIVGLHRQITAAPFKLPQAMSGQLASTSVERLLLFFFFFSSNFTRVPTAFSQRSQIRFAVISAETRDVKNKLRVYLHVNLCQCIHACMHTERLIHCPL